MGSFLGLEAKQMHHGAKIYTSNENGAHRGFGARSCTYVHIFSRPASSVAQAHHKIGTFNGLGLDLRTSSRKFKNFVYQYYNGLYGYFLQSTRVARTVHKF